MPKMLRRVSPRRPFAVFEMEEVQGVEYPGIVVVCDDGAFLVWNWREMEWTEYPAVPGTPAAVEK
jgi:hypothetical protein